MIEHLVLFKLSRPMTAAEMQSAIGKLKRIPGVAAVTIGENYTQRGQGFNAASRITLTSKEAEACYQTHPLHVEARDTIIKPLLTGESPVLAIDYEYDEHGTGMSQYFHVGLGFVAGLFASVALRSLRSLRP